MTILWWTTWMLTRRTQFREFGLGSFHQLAVARRDCDPFVEHGFESCASCIEILRRRHDNVSVGIGSELLHGLAFGGFIRTDEALCHPFPAMFSDEVLSRLREALELLAIHDQ